jgi:hypothetical protein
MIQTQTMMVTVTVMVLVMAVLVIEGNAKVGSGNVREATRLYIQTQA